MSEHVSMSKRNDPGEREGVTDNQSNKVPEKAGQDRLQGTHRRKKWPWTEEGHLLSWNGRGNGDEARV